MENSSRKLFFSSAEILFGDLTNKETILSRIREIPASPRSIEKRITDMAENVTVKQTTGLQQAVVFSVALDKSVDVNDVARLAIVVWCCDSDHLYEELCCLIPLGGTVKGVNIITAFVSYFENQNININKIFCVTTDAAPAMVGKNKGFVKLLQDHIGRQVLSFHCIIHQESLCAKMSSLCLNFVMGTVIKIVNFIVSRSSLIHRQFKSLLQEMESAYMDLPLYSNVHWLSRGNVLNRFVSSLEAIKVFLDEKEQHFLELNNDDWLCKLMFLADITKHLNDLNLSLQGQGQTVLELFEQWKGFASKLDIFCHDITANTYKFFPNVKAHSNRFTVNRDELQKYVEALKGEFAKRGQDFQIHGPMFSYLIEPDLTDLTTTPFDPSLFEWMDVDNFEMQHIKFKSSELWTT